MRIFKHRPLAGSTNFEDRDLERINADLRVMPVQPRVRLGKSTMPSASRRARTRTASGTDMAV